MSLRILILKSKRNQKCNGWCTLTLGEKRFSKLFSSPLQRCETMENAPNFDINFYVFEDNLVFEVDGDIMANQNENSCEGPGRGEATGTRFVNMSESDLQYLLRGKHSIKTKQTTNWCVLVLINNNTISNLNKLLTEY